MFVIDTSQGESSQTIHSLKKVSFFFILEIKSVFFFSKFHGYSMEFLNTRFLTGSHTYRCIGNYQKMDWGEMILKVEEGHTSKLHTYDSYGVPIALWVSLWDLGWRRENVELIHRPYTRYCGLFTHHYWDFFGNDYFWNNSSLKIWRGRVCHTTRLSEILLIFSVGGATLNGCKSRLNHTIFVKE